MCVIFTSMRKAAVAVTIILVSLFPAAALAADFNWEASSGLFPDEVCPRMVLTDTAAPEDPILSNGRLQIATSSDAEVMVYEQRGSDIGYRLFKKPRVIPAIGDRYENIRE